MAVCSLCKPRGKALQPDDWNAQNEILRDVMLRGCEILLRAMVALL
jgi:hypothetical protein